MQHLLFFSFFVDKYRKINADILKDNKFRLLFSGAMPVRNNDACQMVRWANYVGVA
jgi:hypothetical protein